MLLKIRFPSETNAALFREIMEQDFPELRDSFTWNISEVELNWVTVGDGDVSRITETARDYGGYILSG